MNYAKFTAVLAGTCNIALKDYLEDKKILLTSF